MCVTECSAPTGIVTRLVTYMDHNRAFADLGLTSNTGA